MADEQIIIVQPEEDLTHLRERLEQVQNRYIILVVQPPTQLRSHLSWRLLHSRVRELGKDVLVVTSDRQIRSIAKVSERAAPLADRYGEMDRRRVPVVHRMEMLILQRAKLVP